MNAIRTCWKGLTRHCYHFRAKQRIELPKDAGVVIVKLFADTSRCVNRHAERVFKFEGGA
jgi:hypothetical protein